MQINGIEIARDQISRNGLDWTATFNPLRPPNGGTMSLVPEDLAAAGEPIMGRELLTPRVRPQNPEVTRAMDQALVEVMVFCLADSPSNDLRNVQRHRARVMRRLGGDNGEP